MCIPSAKIILVLPKYKCTNIAIGNNYIFITSKTRYFKITLQQKFKFNLDLLKSAGYNLTPLYCPVTQSFIPFPFKPQLYHIPIKSTHTPLYVINVDRYFFFFYIISVIWVIIYILLPIYIFLYKHYFQAYIFQFYFVQVCINETCNL